MFKWLGKCHPHVYDVYDKDYQTSRWEVELDTVYVIEEEYYRCDYTLKDLTGKVPLQHGYVNGYKVIAAEEDAIINAKWQALGIERAEGKPHHRTEKFNVSGN